MHARLLALEHNQHSAVSPTQQFDLACVRYQAWLIWVQ